MRREREPTNGGAPSGRGAGQGAGTPAQFPKPAWGQILSRTKTEISRDNLSLVSGGVAFYAFLAIFPALIAMVSIYGYFADPQQVQQLVDSSRGVLPGQAADVLDDQLTGIVQSSESALGWGAILGILAALWSSTKGTKGLMTALNIVYDEQEKRGFFKLNAVAFALTLGLIVAAIAALLLIVGVPAVLAMLAVPEPISTVVQWSRWPLLAVGFAVALAAFYRYAPSREPARWHWVSWGSGVATVLWLVASGLFSWYVANFGNYSETYGALGAVAILLLWLSLSAYVVLLGAELNAEMERQTPRDTTTGEPLPMGERQAQVADREARRDR